MFLKIALKYTVLFTGLLLSCGANAVVDRTVNLYLSNPTVTGPADRVAFAATINTWGNSGYAQVCADTSINYNVGRIDLTSLVPYTGRTHQQSSAFPLIYLFESGVEGLAFAPNINGAWLSSPMSSGASLMPGTNTVYRGRVLNASRPTAFATSTFSYLRKDAGRILVGQTLVPGQNLYRFDCYDTNDVLQETLTVYAVPYTIYSSVTSCTSNQTNLTIPMRGLRLEDVENASVGTVFETTSRNFSIICQPDINVYITVNDLVDPSNLTQNSKLTSDSTARGIGYRVSSTNYSSGFLFSPQGSAPGMVGRSQYFLKRSTSNNELVDFNLNFSYVKTDNEVSEGKAKSIIGITYSYQ